MLNLVNELLKREYIPLNKVEINRTALISNYRYLKSLHKGVSIAPVLKSNAYGHGIIQVAQILDHLNPPMFCVDSLFEAYELYKAKIKTPILVMGYIHPQSLKVKRLPFSYAIFNKDQADVINRYQKGASVHIKVDTGMNRMGISISDLSDLAAYLKTLKNVNVVGLMSHIAFQEDKNNPLTKEQEKHFEKAKKIIIQNGITPRWFHLGASQVLLEENRLKNVSNLARVGLALYGIDPSRKHPKLKPVLSLKSQIVQIKELKAGDRVGYSGTYTAMGNMNIGILPIGYNDGVDRRLSNKGTVLVHNKVCRIIGLVNMNITVIDLGTVKNPKVGDKAIIFSNDTTSPNSIEKAASICKTIPYELLIHLSATSLKRVIT